MLVIDDALLLRVLARTAVSDVQEAADAAEAFTTHSWYWRLTRALYDRASRGSLTRRFRELEPEAQARVLADIERLPPEIGIVSSRRLIPVMATLDAGRPLNMLTAEAVATARLIESTIAVTTESALMTDACQRLGIELRQV